MRRYFVSSLLAGVLLLAAGCQCGPEVEPPDAGATDAGLDAGRPQRDAGVVRPGSPDASWPSTYASERCPDELFDGGTDAGDGGVRFGICIVLHTLSAQVTLDGQPETNPIETHLQSGTATLELTQTPVDGQLQLRAMRGRYEILKHQPGGVWPYFEGFIDHGGIDLTTDQEREFSAKSHRLRGAARFGSLPFTPNGFPPDVYLRASGDPLYQLAGVTSVGGAWELRLLEGTFGLLLSTPAVSLFGTELTDYPVTNHGVVTFDRDQEFDIDIPTALLEGSVTIDGQPLPDAQPGPDYSVVYTRPGDTDSAVRSRHEGGTAEFTALVPTGTYGATLEFQGLPNRSYPSRIYGVSLAQGVDLTHDATVTKDFQTVSIEGALVIDGKPARANPFYNTQLFFFGAANMVQGSDFWLYEVPLESASFNIRLPTGLYFAMIKLDEGLAESLATGYWVLDRFFVVQGNRSLPVVLETSRFQGKLLIDGKPPPPDKPAGIFTFRNRALQGAYSFFQKTITTAADGTFEVKLPKGEYQVFFTIDPTTFPNYATGRQELLTRVDLSQDWVNELRYDTITMSGPLRVDGQVVPNSLSGAEVGLLMTRQQDFQDFTWEFYGGSSEYEVHVPPGTYAMDFVIHQDALDGVAFGHAPMGMELNIATVADSFMSFLK